MRVAKVMAALAAATMPALASAAVNYTQSPPLTRVVDSSVGTVAAGPVQVPIITWGGDMATI